MKKKIHLGKLIKEKFEESNLSISEFARRINRSRSVVYDIFERQSIDIEMLENISEALNFDFLKYLCFEEKEEKKLSKDLYIILKVVEKENLPNEGSYIFSFKIKK